MRVLFFGIQYHSYTSAIISEMEALGAEVTFVDLQPRTVAYKMIRTLMRTVFDRMVRQQLLNAVEASRSTHYDKVVFLQAHQMPLDVLDRLRDAQPKAQFSLYNWDSVATHDYRPQAAYFDRILTFDRRDAEAHGYGYLPLFCIRRWQDLKTNKASPRSVYMVGNIVRLERYRAVEQFRAYCSTQGVTFLQHLKISPLVLMHSLRQGILPRGLSLRAIPESRFATMIESSVAAFDFANHAQSGQTMRMIESLCSGKKIITNNQWVKQEPFFSSDRIHVFEGIDFSGVSDFLDTPIADPSARFEGYFVQSFTRKFLGLDAVPGIRGNYD